MASFGRRRARWATEPGLNTHVARLARFDSIGGCTPSRTVFPRLQFCRRKSARLLVKKGAGEDP
jgi:hypothetical protein